MEEKEGGIEGRKYYLQRPQEDCVYVCVCVCIQ